MSALFQWVGRSLAALFLCVPGFPGEARAEERPNVLFIISDDLGAQSLGCYGNTQVKTPHLDKLARSGVQFDRAYCQYPVCGPARAALMSGRYAQAVGVTGNGSSANFTKWMIGRPSMAQLFKEAGYYSARCSKIYHMRVPGDITAGVDGPDHLASWTERFNSHAPEWMTEGEKSHLSREKLKFDKDKHYNLGFGAAFYVVKGAGDGAEQADHIAATKAIELLEKHKDRPFFLALGLVRPHVPLVAPVSYYAPYDPPTMQLPQAVENDWDDIPKSAISKNSQSTGLNDKLSKQKVLSAYYASVSYMDAQAGRVIDALDRLGLRENTIVVFLSDHGYHLGEHEFWQKMSMHEESVRIPMIISAPGVKAAKTQALAESIDLFPTLAELAGLSVPAHCQGVSLTKVLDDPEVSVRRTAYCFRKNAHMIRDDRWAYLVHEKGEVKGEELYDMANDPKQFRNLAPVPENSGDLERMRKLLAAKLEEIEKSLKQ